MKQMCTKTMDSINQREILVALLSNGGFLDGSADLFTRSILNDYIASKNDAEKIHEADTDGVDEYLNV